VGYCRHHVFRVEYRAFGSGSGAASVPGSYAINGWLSVDHAPADSFPNYFFRRDTDLQAPAKIPLFQDSIWFYIFPLETDPTPNPSDLYTGYFGQRTGCEHSMGLCLIDRHSDVPASGAARAYNFSSGPALPGRINMVFADNHAELVLLNNLWNYKWHLGWETPIPHP
jgi:prepilin-type processing-associated H-X9-DG protein